MSTYPELLGPGIAISRSRWPAGAGGRSARECRQQVCTGKCGRRGQFPCRFCRAGISFCHGPVACGMIELIDCEERRALPYPFMPIFATLEFLQNSKRRGYRAISSEAAAQLNGRREGCKIGSKERVGVSRSFALLTFFRFWEFRKGCHSHQNMV